MPKGVHHVDLTTSDRRSYLFGIEKNWLNILEGQFSTNIQEIDGTIDKHDWFGFPKVAILNPGLHRLKLHCSWSRFGQTWNRSSKTLDFDFQPDAIYVIESALGAKARSRKNKCQIQVRMVERSDYTLIPKYQAEILSRYGISGWAY